MTVAAIVAVAIGCGEPHRTERAAEAFQGAPRYIAFRQPNYTINRLEMPLTPPIAVGSTLSGELLWSSDASTVSIDPAGNLVAHKNGEAIVRASGGASLNVRVEAVHSMQIVPSSIELVPGGSTAVRVVGDGRHLSTDSYSWETTDPNVAAAFNGTVQAGYVSGEATLTARSGSAQGVVKVVVRSASVPLRAVDGPGSIAVGKVAEFRVEGSPQVSLVWSSTNPAALQPLRGGLFYARAAGRVEVCAESEGARLCRSIRVVRRLSQ